MGLVAEAKSSSSFTCANSETVGPASVRAVDGFWKRPGIQPAVLRPRTDVRGGGERLGDCVDEEYLASILRRREAV